MIIKNYNVFIILWYIKFILYINFIYLIKLSVSTRQKYKQGKQIIEKDRDKLKIRQLVPSSIS